MEINGSRIYDLAKTIYPLPRSISGNAVRKTLSHIQDLLPDLKIHEISTGTKCFDWTIPEEWNVWAAYIETLDGKKIIDWKENNLHLVSYSTAIDKIVSKNELLEHLYTRPDMPDVIPYVTSYYERNWGFCISEKQRQSLDQEHYRVVIDSELKQGSITYGELLIPGESEEEILLHSYTCHPSMGNNETSGVAVASFLARYVMDLDNRRYSYRLVLVPETIGAVAYISQKLDTLKQKVIAGFILTCVGDERTYSFMPSRIGGVLAERVALHAMNSVLKIPFDHYSFLQRGSDERQYCAPGVDIPVVSIMRSKYGTYPEYHTSLDDLSLISAAGLFGGYEVNKVAIDILEVNETLKSTVLCEPMLGPRGLRPPLALGRNLVSWSGLISNILAYADGEHDLLAIADIIECSIFDLKEPVSILKKEGLLEVI